jgi:hypothetical protein
VGVRIQPDRTIGAAAALALAIVAGGCGSTSKSSGDAAAGSDGSSMDGAGGAGGTGGAGGAGGATCALQGQGCSSTMPCCAGLICAGSCSQGVSDRNLKRDFAPVDDDAILRSLMDLPISTWRYKTDDPATRHIGPTAQDFQSAFHVGASDKLILQVDGDGVAFAAIKSLNARLARLDEENAALRRELSRLRVDMQQRHRTDKETRHASK